MEKTNPNRIIKNLTLFWASLVSIVASFGVRSTNKTRLHYPNFHKSFNYIFKRQNSRKIVQIKSVTKNKFLLYDVPKLAYKIKYIFNCYKSTYKMSSASRGKEAIFVTLRPWNQLTVWMINFKLRCSWRMRSTVSLKTGIFMQFLLWIPNKYNY